MAALSPERTQISRPFNTVGVDFAGPFEIKSYIGRRCICVLFYQRGSPLLSPAEPDLDNENITLANRCQRLNIQHHQFCKRWKDEYLKELYKRYKRKKPKRPVEVNDIVVIKQNNLPPNEWVLGRVTKTLPGSDGLPRVVVLRTSTGTLTRPITKVVVIPTQ